MPTKWQLCSTDQGRHARAAGSKKTIHNRLSSEFQFWPVLWPPLTTRVAIRRCGVANPGILGKPFVCHPAKRTKCVTEKYRSGVEGLVVSLHPSGNGSLGLRTTNHHDSHVTLLPLWGYASRITDLACRNDEATVTISRRCQGADRVRFTNGTGARIYCAAAR